MPSASHGTNQNRFAILMCSGAEGALQIAGERIRPQAVRDFGFDLAQKTGPEARAAPGPAAAAMPVAATRIAARTKAAANVAPERLPMARPSRL